MTQDHDTTGAQATPEYVGLFLRFTGKSLTSDLERLLPLLEDDELAQVATGLGREMAARALRTATLPPLSAVSAEWFAKSNAALAELEEWARRESAAIEERFRG